MSGNWLLLAVLVIGCAGSRPSPAGSGGSGLAPCPDRPNCVSSQSTDERHAVAPLRYDGAAEAAMQRLVEVIRGMKRAHITTVRERYLHAEFTSLLFRFVDDVEFLLEKETNTIHVRSASRVGTSDLGVNRRRVEAIRSRFDALRGKDGFSPASDRSP
ncbi:MAG: DUF1499 domain-containing protein [Syntrophales bacterium]